MNMASLTTYFIGVVIGLMACLVRGRRMTGFAYDTCGTVVSCQFRSLGKGRGKVGSTCNLVFFGRMTTLAGKVTAIGAKVYIKLARG